MYIFASFSGTTSVNFFYFNFFSQYPAKIFCFIFGHNDVLIEDVFVLAKHERDTGCIHLCDNIRISIEHALVMYTSVHKCVICDQCDNICIEHVLVISTEHLLVRAEHKRHAAFVNL